MYDKDKELSEDSEEKQTSCLRKKATNIKKAMIWNGYIRFTSASLIKIAVFSFLQLIDLNWETWPNCIASGLAIFGTIYVTTFPFIILFIMIRNRKNLNNPEFKKKFGGIYDLYKEKSLWRSCFIFFRLIRKLIFSGCLVFY